METCYEGELFFNLKRSCSICSERSPEVRIYNRTGHLLIPTKNSKPAVPSPVSPVPGPRLTVSSVCFGTSVFPLRFREAFPKDFGTSYLISKFKGCMGQQTKIVNPGDFSDPAGCLLTDHTWLFCFAASWFPWPEPHHQCYGHGGTMTSPMVTLLQAQMWFTGFLAMRLTVHVIGHPRRLNWK